MATKIVTKNSSTASAVPTASDLVQGELAVNVADKRLFTEDNGGSIIELGTNPSTIDINAGSIDGTAIGASSASTGAFTTLTASGAFTSVGIDDNATSTAITIDSSENVGIGTSTTVRKLTVNETGTSAIAHFESDQSASKVYFHDANTSQTYSVALGSVGDDMVFYASSGGSERMRIDSSGNVGIGTTTLSYKFQISDGTRTAIINPNSSLDGIFFGTKESKPLIIGTADNERMRIDSSGNILFGKTAASTAGQGIFIEPSGIGYGRANFVSQSTVGIPLAFYYDNGSTPVNVGRIQTSTTSTSYVTSSDYRLKENVVELTGATERLKQLNPSRFNFIADADTTVDGFLAHEVADVVPEAISGEKDAMKDEEYEVTPAVLDEEGNVVTEAVIGTRSVPEYQGIDQSKLVPLLVATIQELEARITQLENN